VEALFSYSSNGSVPMPATYECRINNQNNEPLEDMSLVIVSSTGESITHKYPNIIAGKTTATIYKKLRQRLDLHISAIKQKFPVRNEKPPGVRFCFPFRTGSRPEFGSVSRSERRTARRPVPAFVRNGHCRAVVGEL
jgi:hypothetical protein